MTCDEVQSVLGTWTDAELAPDLAERVRGHVARCDRCAEEARALTSRLTTRLAVTAPPQLWTAIESRLRDGEAPVRSKQDAGARSPVYRRRFFAVAAAFLALVSTGVILWNEGVLGGRAVAAGIDFRPLLEQADGDIGAGIEALVRAHGGRSITRKEAEQIMTVRIHPPAFLPAGMKLAGMYLLKMGTRHRSLAFHFTGPRGQLLLLQCPAGVRKNYGNEECLPCKLNAGANHAVHVGPLRLLHRDSDKLCMCIVSTLDETTDLPAVLDAIPVDY